MNSYDEWKLASPPDQEPVTEIRDFDVTITFTVPIEVEVTDPWPMEDARWVTLEMQRLWNAAHPDMRIKVAMLIEVEEEAQ